MSRSLPLPSRPKVYVARSYARGRVSRLFPIVPFLSHVWPRRAPPAGRSIRPPVPDFDPTPVAKCATAKAPSLVLRGHRIEVGKKHPDAASLSEGLGVYVCLATFGVLVLLVAPRCVAADPVPPSVAGYSIASADVRALPAGSVTFVSWTGATLTDPLAAPSPVIGLLIAGPRPTPDVYVVNPFPHTHMLGPFVQGGDYDFVGNALVFPDPGPAYGSEGVEVRACRAAYARLLQLHRHPAPPLFPVPGPDFRLLARGALAVLAGFALLAALVGTLRYHAGRQDRAIAARRDFVASLEAEVREREEYASHLEKQIRKRLGDTYVDPTTLGPAGRL